MTIHPSIKKKDEFIYLTINLYPRSSQEKLTVTSESIDVFIKEPPLKGRANLALLKMLAKYLNLSTSSLKIVSGKTAKTKIIQIINKTEEELKELFSLDN